MSTLDLTKAQADIGVQFNDIALLEQALTHASLVDERLDSNERLEFLGDSVLGLVVCEYLFAHFDHMLEGELTKIKSSVVSRRICAEIVKKRSLDRLLQLGKGLSSRSALPSSVLAAVYESLIGAIYVDGGMDAAREFILRDMRDRIDAAVNSGHQQNYKSVLQQTVQQELDQTPQYMLLDEQGPDHAKCFEVCVALGSRRFKSAWGPSKKQAEQQAALEALCELGYAGRGEDGDVHLIDDDEQDAA